MEAGNQYCAFQQSSVIAQWNQHIQISLDTFQQLTELLPPSLHTVIVAVLSYFLFFKR